MASGEVRTLLAKFGLKADHVNRPVDELSPGERTRAGLALLQARGVNVLVLDEPTNHLDLRGHRAARAGARVVRRHAAAGDPRPADAGHRADRSAVARRGRAGHRAVTSVAAQRPWRFLYGFGWPLTTGARPLPFDAFALPPPGAFGLLGRRGRRGDLLLRVGEEEDSGLRQPGRAVAAGEERMPDFVLELVDRRVEGGEGDAECLRRPREVQLFGNRDEPLELGDVHRSLHSPDGLARG